MDKNFNKIFWFLAGCVAFVFIYTWAITFYPIPKPNIRFADSALSFFLGTVVGAGAIGFLTGRSAPGKTTPTSINTETTTIEKTTTTDDKPPCDGVQ
jgi:hypothetical protein